MSLKEGQILIKNARLGYPKLWNPEAVKGDPKAEPRYGCVIHIPKSDKKFKEAFDAEVDRAVKDRLNGQKPKAKDICLVDGDGDDGDDTTAGYWLISANRKERQGPPQIVDRNPSINLKQHDPKLYAGCRCNFLIGIYVPKNWSKICASLEVVQFVNDDEPFGGGGVKADAVMPTLDDEEDDI